MRALSNPRTINRLIALLLILLLVKLLWLVTEIAFMPVAGVNHTQSKEAKPLYYRIRLTPGSSIAPRPKPKKQIAGSIRDITLLGVYHSPSQTVVTVSYKGKSKVLAKGESVNGFVLEGAGSGYALFTKSGKTYRVELLEKKSSGNYKVSTPKRKAVVPSSSASPEGEVIDAGDHKIVDKSLLEHYTAHMDEIYKNIGIRDVKKSGRIEGFRVTFVKRGSPFSKLGLRRGDVLKAVNGQPLTSYKAAFDAYKSVSDAAGLTLTIQRGNKEMELEYEIN